jgi:hypothetical protein
MPQVVDVNLDINEMVLSISNGKKAATAKVAYDSILKLEVRQDVEKKWFLSKAVKKIVIYVKGKEEPYIIRSDKFNASFDNTEAYLVQVAENHDRPVERS